MLNDTGVISTYSVSGAYYAVALLWRMPLVEVALILMLVLINDKRIMGRFTNGRIFNILAWMTSIVLILLATVLIVVTFLPR